MRRGNQLKIIYAVACLAGLVMGVHAQEAAKPRVALVATTMNPDSEKFLDLALVELTQRGDIEIVERQDIRKVMGEQELVLGQAEGTLAVGRLLRADVIGVLETSPDGKEAGGFAVLDTATGVSYWNQGLDAKSIEGVAGEIVAGVSAALDKRGRAGNLSTVCMLGARNAEFPRSMDVFCETVAYLLDRQLVANPSVTTLDRRRLESVISENTLPGVESKSDSLLPALRLVELDFRRGESEDEIKVLARVTDSGGNLLAQPEVTGPVDTAELADRLRVALAEALQILPQAMKGNREKEANRFRRQGQILWGRGMQSQAIQSLDAAYALNPGTKSQISDYADALYHRANSMAREEHFETALEFMDRAFDVEDRHGVRHKHMAESGRDITLTALMECKKGISLDSPLRTEYDRLRRRYITAIGLTDSSGTPSAATLNAEASTLCIVGGVPVLYPRNYSEQLRFPVIASLILSRDANEFFQLLEVRLRPWFKREADPNQPHDAGIITTLDSLCGGHLNRYVWDSRGCIPFDSTYVAGLRDIATRFKAHPRRVVQLEGDFFELWIDVEVEERGGQAVPPGELAQRARALVDAALAAAGQGNALPAGDLAIVYEMAARAAMLMPPPPEGMPAGALWRKELLRISQAMFGHGYVSGAVLNTIMKPHIEFSTYRLPVLRLLNIARNDPSTIWSGITRREVKEYLKALPTEKQASGWKNVSRLMWEAPKPPSHWARQVGLPVQGEEALYAFTGWEPPYFPNDGALVDLLRIDVESGRKEPLGRIHPQTCWVGQYSDAQMGIGCEGDFIENAVRLDGHLWIATSGDGLYGVPLKPGENPIHIGMTDGLPSDVIHSVAVAGDVLYVGCGEFKTEGYLATYDPVTKQCAVIVSTMRASPETPLDSLQGGFRIRAIVPDLPRARILLVIDNGDLKPATGLWECRLAGGEIRQLLQMDRAAHSIHMAADGKLWIYPLCRNEWRPVREKHGWYGAVEFDPETDSARLAFASKKKGAGPTLPVRSDTRIFGTLHHAGAMVAEGWLYHFAEITVDGDTVMELRRVSLATREIQAIDGGLFRGNIYHLGWIRWLPGKRIILAGDGERIVAVQMDPPGDDDE